ncbi:hypothetical protein C8R44DRAFT_980394 [Mycena epipterygia]|nr:hypothetical protein C8R44DRAFT_980394 [Mycena epipterygia]
MLYLQLMSFRRFAGLAMVSICFLAFYHIQQGDLRQPYEPLIRPFEGYRQRLGTLLPIDKPPLSRTLGAGRVYVIGQPSQSEDTLLLASALDIDLTWHNATDHQDEITNIIVERIRWWRDAHRVHAVDKNQDFSPFTFEWPKDIQQEAGPLELKGADLWTAPGFPELPHPPIPDDRPPLHAVYAETVFIPDLIHPEWVAHWKSHYDVLRKIAEGDDETAIVLEDNIDVEWELEMRLNHFIPALPAQWDVLMLGHCSNSETTHAPIRSSPFIHPSNMPRCTPGYVVTRRGAQRLVRRLRNAAFAFSRPIDQAFAHIIEAQREHERHPGRGLNPGMRFFSVYPPVVVRRYTPQLDTQDGSEIERLEDSTRARMALLPGPTSET